MPFHKENSWLYEAIDSCCTELKEINGELLLIADSIDTSPDLINYVASKKLDISIKKSPGYGIVDALNYGLSISKYEYIARMDSDDIMLSGRLQSQYQFLYNNPDFSVVGGNIELISDTGKSLRVIRYPSGSELINKMEQGCYIAHPSVMFKKNTIIEVGGYSKVFEYCEDYDLWDRVSHISKINNIDKLLIQYRQHTSQTSIIKSEIQISSTEAIILRKKINTHKIKSPSWVPTKTDEIFEWIEEVKKMNNLKKENLQLYTKAVSEYLRKINSKNIIQKVSSLKFALLIIILKPSVIKKKISIFICKTKVRTSTKLLKKSKEHHSIALHTKLVGGFGNQLFQFFMGLNLAAKNKTHLVIDDTHYDSSKLHENTLKRYLSTSKSLKSFNVQVSFESEKNCRETFQVFEQTFHLNSVTLSENKCTTLNGYWQSEKYFDSIANLIKAEFGVSRKFDGITIHVRRGDMWQNPESRKVHGYLEFAYYESALNLMPSNLPIRIVSDSTKLARDLFKNCKKEIQFIETNSDVLLDFNLLAESRYLIVANSTFSWWAAYLSEAERIIAPRKWFSEEYLRRNNVCDLFPEDWILC